MPVLSAYNDDRYLWGMWAGGAWGYLLKNEAPGKIVAAVRAAKACPEGSRRVVAWARWDLPAGLTRREIEVLRLVAVGLGNKEIAQRLQMTKRTVEFHVSNILKKLGAASRVEAAMWVKGQGLVFWVGSDDY